MMLTPSAVSRVENVCERGRTGERGDSDGREEVVPRARRRRKEDASAHAESARLSPASSSTVLSRCVLNLAGMMLN
jgi:hypothetical protein